MNAVERLLRQIVVPAILRAADPGEALTQHWARLPNEPRGLALLAFGKASVAMTEVTVRLAADRVQRGLVVARPDHVERVPRLGGRLRALAADHPIPTSRNVEAARVVSEFVKNVDVGQRLVVLISGGGSAQLSAPRSPLTLEQIASLTDGLLRSGATINEINCVRKHCEYVKGGQLGRLACPEPVTVFVLSDVLGDPLDVISSGPFAPDPTTFADAIDVLERRGLAITHAEARALLHRGSVGEIKETPKPGDPAFARVEHFVIANNEQATRAAATALRGFGLEVVDVQLGVQGEAAKVGARLARAVRTLAPGSAIVWGGETTVSVGEAAGKGGRNQELALAGAVELSGMGGAGMLSLATDGIDGPTDAAGGWADGDSIMRMRNAGLDPADALHCHDSYPALLACGGLLRLGASGTNVNDVMVGVRLASQ